MTLKQAAELLNLSPYTIYGLCSKGKLSHYKQGKQLRFKRTELLFYIESGKQQTHDEIKEGIQKTLSNFNNGRG